MTGTITDDDGSERTNFRPNTLFDDITAMGADLTTDRSFDEYAARFGWAYDNGGKYRGEYWNWYIGKSAGIVLLRQGPDRVCVVRFFGLTPFQIWSGAIRTSDDFDRMTSSVTPKSETDETTGV